MEESPNPAPIRVNYLYFGLFLAILLFIATCSMVLKENMVGSRFFFFFHAIGQAVLETLLFIFGGWLIRMWLGAFAFWTFIGASFIVCCLHVLDFMLDRVLDLSVFDTIGFVYDESFDNFIYLLDASGVPLWMWAVFFALLACLPLFGALAYKGADLLAQKRPLRIRCEYFLQAFVCIPAALVFWDFSASRMIHPDAYNTFRKSLPWKQTLFQPKAVEFNTGKLTPPQSERAVIAAIDEVEISVRKKPPIFLFITESLREDFLTHDTAPHLALFREQNLHAEVSLSNANGTMISWFSIFHSQFPYFWNQTKKAKWQSGSPALALFKKLGYQIHVYSAAQLGYYGMDQLIFGHDHHLADSFHLFDHTAPKPACNADFEALSALKAHLANDPNHGEGSVFVLFFDSTHFDYSWPRTGPAKFIPFGSEISYFQAYQSQKNIELIKNRYRNAIHYVDSLFGQFLEVAPENALIVFTGDHGEEFFDQGHLFHNSHLSKSQTNVPLYLKIPGGARTVPLMSQMDIMPTLLDAVTGSTFSFLQGESALRERKWPFAVIARFNAGRCPYEWCLHNGQEKLILQFDNRKQITESEKVHLISLRTYQDQSFPRSKKPSEAWVEHHFLEAFDRLFAHD